jgi:hypothetical protein
METISQLLPTAIILIVLDGAILTACYYFKYPTKEQLECVSEWLLHAVTNAEISLGSGTGALKLRQVYDMFVTRFPTIARRLPFSVFSDMVDDALVVMRDMLEKNHAARELVEGQAKQL